MNQDSTAFDFEHTDTGSLTKNMFQTPYKHKESLLSVDEWDTPQTKVSLDELEDSLDITGPFGILDFGSTEKDLMLDGADPSLDFINRHTQGRVNHFTDDCFGPTNFNDHHYNFGDDPFLKKESPDWAFSPAVCTGYPTIGKCKFFFAQFSLLI